MSPTAHLPRRATLAAGLLLLASCGQAINEQVGGLLQGPVRVDAMGSPFDDAGVPTEDYEHPRYDNGDGTFTQVMWLPKGQVSTIERALGELPQWKAVNPTLSKGVVVADPNADGADLIKNWKGVSGLETVILRGTLDEIDRCSGLINYFLVSIPQILIEARVVEVLETDQFALGMDFFLLEREDQGGAGRTGALDPTATIFDRGGFGRGIPALPGVVRGEIIPNMLLELGTVKDNLRIDFVVEALKQLTKVDVVNSPNVAVRSGHQALITSGQDVPYFTIQVSGSNTSHSTKFREVGVKLNVLPTLLTPDLIQLSVDLRVENITGVSTVVSGGAATSNPIVSSRRVTTTMSVKNGATVVLGGLITTQDFQVKDKVPVLSDIPLMGSLFTNRNREQARSNLLFIIRPRVMGNPLAGDSEVIEPPALPLFPDEDFEGEDGGDGEGADAALVPAPNGG